MTQKAEPRSARYNPELWPRLPESRPGPVNELVTYPAGFRNLCCVGTPVVPVPVGLSIAFSDICPLPYFNDKDLSFSSQASGWEEQPLQSFTHGSSPQSPICRSAWLDGILDSKLTPWWEEALEVSGETMSPVCGCELLDRRRTAVSCVFKDGCDICHPAPFSMVWLCDFAIPPIQGVGRFVIPAAWISIGWCCARSQENAAQMKPCGFQGKATKGDAAFTSFTGTLTDENCCCQKSSHGLSLGYVPGKS